MLSTFKGIESSHDGLGTTLEHRRLSVSWSFVITEGPDVSITLPLNVLLGSRRGNASAYLAIPPWKDIHLSPRPAKFPESEGRYPESRPRDLFSKASKRDGTMEHHSHIVYLNNQCAQRYGLLGTEGIYRRYSLTTSSSPHTPALFLYMPCQLASPTPSAELPGEIDMDLWAQLENEMERVDEDGEDAKDEVMVYAPAGQVDNDRVSQADNDTDDLYFMNAVVASVDTHTTASTDQVQFVASSSNEATTTFSDPLEELYPYRNLSRNERRYIATQIKKAHVNNLPPIPDHLRADNFKQAVDWTRGKAIPKWYEPGVVASNPASPSKPNETTKKDDPSPKRGRKRARSTTDSRSPSPSKKQRRGIPELPILKTWGKTPAIPSDAYWTIPTAYCSPSFKPVLVTRHQLFVSERMAAGFTKSYPNLVARMSDILYVESPVLNVATPVVCPQDKCTIALGDLERHIIEYHKIPGTEESFICRCSSRRSRIKKTETFTSSKEMLKHFHGMHLVDIKSCCPYCSARITAEDENMIRHWYQCCKGFKALNEEASRAA